MMSSFIHSLNHPPTYLLGHAVGRAGVEGGGFRLGHFLDFAIQLRGGGLVEAGGLLEPAGTHGVEETEGADAVWKRWVGGWVGRWVDSLFL